WRDSRVLELLSENYIIIALYTDDKTELLENEWYTSQTNGKVMKTLGKKNAAMEVDMFGTNAQPLYVITDTNGKILTSQKLYAYNTSIDDFIAYLEEGIEAYQ
ncbi:MAG: hypothetical protein MI922_00370, partial [Bacteroidales bacterium]|nr:hypothetical protein [Bacteroidales bacterium]